MPNDTHLSQKAHHVKRTLSVESRRRLVAKESVWGRERLKPHPEAALLAAGKAPAKDVPDDDVTLLGETERCEESSDLVVVDPLSREPHVVRTVAVDGEEAVKLVLLRDEGVALVRG